MIRAFQTTFSRSIRILRWREQLLTALQLTAVTDSSSRGLATATVSSVVGELQFSVLERIRRRHGLKMRMPLCRKTRLIPRQTQSHYRIV